MHKFIRFHLQEEFVVKKLISFHYSELTKDYVFAGEKHNFWEFLYMDKGEAEITTGGRAYEVKQGELIFYKPNEFHSLRASSKSAPNVLIVCFECHSPAMNRFKSCHYHLTDQERSILSQLVREGRVAFDPPVDRPKNVPLKRKIPRSFGSEQMIKLFLEMLLIQLARQEIELEQSRKLSSSAREKQDSEISSRLVAYLQKNVSNHYTLDELSATFHIGKTRMKTVFKKETGYSIVEYMNRLKIEQAKKYIREENWSYTKIAEILGYSSIHYFSKHFKKEMDMTPSEYDKSLKARALDQ